MGTLTVKDLLVLAGPVNASVDIFFSQHYNLV